MPLHTFSPQPPRYTHTHVHAKTPSNIHACMHLFSLTYTHTYMLTGRLSLHLGVLLFNIKEPTVIKPNNKGSLACLLQQPPFKCWQDGGKIPP